jgi:hypothetical protein
MNHTRAIRFTVGIATCLALLASSTQAASAGPTYGTGEGAIPSGPTQGQDEPGPGARIANKAFGYYIGRVMSGGNLTQVGGRASHYYGRISGPGVNMCGWLHKSARGSQLGRSPNSCSKATADRIWQRTTIGTRFSAPAGAKGQSGDPVSVTPGMDCRLHYNYFVDTSFKRGQLRDQAGPIGPQVRYRYQTRDGQAAVVLDDRLGWGFVDADCLTMRDPVTNQRIKTYNGGDKGFPPRF